MLRDWLNYAGAYCAGLNSDGASTQKERGLMSEMR